MSNYILALDQGTTSSRAILFDKQQNIVGIAQKEFTQFYPHQGWVEHDPQEIYSSQYAVMMEVIAQNGIDPSEIAGIRRPVIRETTALGAAYLAGLAVGFWKSLDEIKQVREIETLFTATMGEDERAALLRGRHKAVERSKNWEN